MLEEGGILQRPVGDVAEEAAFRHWSAMAADMLHQAEQGHIVDGADQPFFFRDADIVIRGNQQAGLGADARQAFVMDHPALRQGDDGLHHDFDAVVAQPLAHDLQDLARVQHRVVSIPRCRQDALAPGCRRQDFGFGQLGLVQFPASRLIAALGPQFLDQRLQHTDFCNHLRQVAGGGFLEAEADEFIEPLAQRVDRFPQFPMVACQIGHLPGQPAVAAGHQQGGLQPEAEYQNEGGGQ